MTDQEPIAGLLDDDDEEPGTPAPRWMKVVLTGLPFVLLVGLLFLEKCRTGG